jgi:GNAT superfamily N-acetyltransferase
MRIRPARPGEQAALEALQLRASTHHPDYREALLANPDAIELPARQIEDGRVLAAEIDGEVIGFSVALPRPDGDFELDGLFVEPLFWRGGVGRVLVEAACAQARAAGSQALRVIANPTALGFYRRCGFVDAGAAETRFGPAPVMMLDLSADA